MGAGCRKGYYDECERYEFVGGGRGGEICEACESCED